MSNRKKILVFASGSKDGGGSGFQWLVEATNTGILDADICAVVSNHENGGVRKIACELGVPFEWMDTSGGISGQSYTRYMDFYQPDLVALSGWLKPVSGLDPRHTINIHPAPLPLFGGNGKYGHLAHEAVIKAFEAGEITSSEVCMHFVTMFNSDSNKDEYDKGPVFFRMPVALRCGDTADTIGRRVNEVEHGLQALITGLVLHDKISWDGIHSESLKVPDWYTLNRQL